MLNINDLVIKIFFALYLGSIYVKYMYMCVLWILPYAFENMCVHSFLVIFWIEKDYVVLYPPIIMFNKAYWFHLQLFPVQVWCATKTDLSYDLHNLFADCYIRMNKFIYERNGLVVYPFWIHVFEEKMTFSWFSYFLFIFWFLLPVGSDMIYSCIPFIVYRKVTSAEKTYVILFGI